MKCQLKYRWVKLPRACLPQGKGVLGQWARLAARRPIGKVWASTAALKTLWSPACGPGAW